MRVRVLIGMVAVLIISLLVWQIVFSQLNNRFLYATFLQTVQGFHRLFIPHFGNSHDYPEFTTGIVAQFSVTFYEILVSFAIAATSGILIGIALGYFRMLGDAYEPVIYVFYAIPAPILYPVMLLTLGIGPASRIAIAIFLAIFPPIVIVSSSIRRTKQSYVRLAKSYGASNSQIFRKVMIPSSVGAILAGLRLSLVFSIIGVIFAEVIASSRGLGSVISISSALFDPVIMFSTIVLMVFIVTGILVALSILERVVMPYAH